MRLVETDALVVRKVSYGDADVIATLLTESDGKVSALMRGGRKSRRRAQGGLEPFHTVRVTFDDRGKELVVLREARVVRVRAGIMSTLDALEAAGLALRWVRHFAPARHAEPQVWATTQELLDDLDAGPPEPRVVLAASALRLLGALGYGLDLVRCVACGRACPEGRPACVSASRGGLICQACGGSAQVLSAGALRLAVNAQRNQPLAGASRAEAEEILSLVDGAMAAHGGFEPK